MIIGKIIQKNIQDDRNNLFNNRSQKQSYYWSCWTIMSNILK